jgi:o-succinylbenzoate synthase
MIQLKVERLNLLFKRPASTSRGVLFSKPSWIFVLTDTERNSRKFHGECSIIPGLSVDDEGRMNTILEDICRTVNREQNLDSVIIPEVFPSVESGFEMLKKDHLAELEKVLFDSEFTAGKRSIAINGLIWMGDKNSMFEQIREKLENNWRCIKLKIGGIDFEEELELLRYIRSHFNSNELELRLDANGAFTPDQALDRLKLLSDFDIHSIEQPIRQDQADKMARLCELSPIPVALDEELIGIVEYERKAELLKQIRPHYIILKPGLLGGLEKSEEWIRAAAEFNIDYWVTSSLESNIGLNAISQWTATLSGEMVHGLGTGMLYKNNFDSPLEVANSKLHYRPEKGWKIDL